ncbi:S9 family peptidase [Tenggerimyces flavus]|uniref:Alpha/beta hydrolase family protein n=1 Tax=Tenggerimyces flavus TaxID=1708749 RepID=A0ABV7YCM1_9ACTN|nr:prolyl oligopeptidase family serine peptidase [Tenggerimyces flavus]MBM7790269.1 alpha-beta hydrolase superfamily lysophospholipase [Tenggerimyces flavus]
MVLTRTGFAFSGDGQVACCLQVDPATRARRVVRWRFGTSGAQPLVVEELAGTPQITRPDAQVLPLRDGKVLVRLLDGDDHAILLMEPPLPPLEVLRLRAAGVRLIGSPTASALVLSTDGRRQTDLITVPSAAELARPRITLPGLVGRTGWSDEGGKRLAVELLTAEGLTIHAIDLVTGTHEPLWPDRSDLRLRLVSATGGYVVVEDRDNRWGLLPLDRSGESRWLPELRSERAQMPLAVDPAGQGLLLRVENGARAGLAIIDTEGVTRTELSLPDGVVGGVAHWSSTAIRFPFGSPGASASIAELMPNDPANDFAAASMRLLPGPRTASVSSTPDGAPTAEHFDRPSGGVVEAVCYGNWRNARDVVIALHGGPDAAWRLTGRGPFPDLVDSGVAVVGVNPRGSRGYPVRESAEIHGAWGGTDLVDVLTVAAAIVGRRGRPVALFGASYGAFLGLLALAAKPALWDRGAVVAPFLSGSRLRSDGGRQARAIVDRFGGASVFVDESGPRDVLAVADLIRARLLIVHGAEDPIVPVTHSRQLVDRLRAGGRAPDYREVPGAGHHPLERPSTAALVSTFLAAEPRDELQVMSPRFRRGNRHSDRINTSGRRDNNDYA